jgi:hypothetical protein
MLRSGRSSGFGPGAQVSCLLAALACLPLSSYAQQALAREGDRWVQVFRGAAPVGPRLRVDAHGPVTLEAGVSRDLAYTAKVSVRARSEAEARRLLAQFAVRVAPQGGWFVVSVPRGPMLSELTLKAPRLTAATIVTSDGAVVANGIDGVLEVSSGAGPLAVDRVHGDCRLVTRGGEIRIGEVWGALQCNTGAGPITARAVRGRAEMQTVGGDIVVQEAGGSVRAETGAGTVRIERAGAEVIATTGGGLIWIGSAKGLVTARNVAGMVHVGAAAGVRSDSAAGGVSLARVSGSMRVSTLMGSIIASLVSGAPADSYLATGNGDITVLIPSNVGVTIQAENGMADTPRRIVSEFPQIQARRYGTRLIAEGAVNGGGPVLKISASIGTIFIKRQR